MKSSQGLSFRTFAITTRVLPCSKCAFGPLRSDWNVASASALLPPRSRKFPPSPLSYELLCRESAYNNKA